MIRNGRDAWEPIGKVETLDAWLKIGAALHVGKLRAIRVTRSNSGWGSAYSKEFGRWMQEFGVRHDAFGFDTMQRDSPRAHRLWHAKAIEQWRQSEVSNSLQTTDG